MDAGDSRSLVCNPVTSEYKIIPDVLVDPKMRLDPGTQSLWLGFSPGTNQYKVLRISFLMNANANGELHKVAAQVFVIGSDLWRDVDDTPPFLCWDLCQTQHVNGLMYCHDVVVWPGVIISFDFEREKFGKVALPPEFQEEQFETKYATSIGVLGGCLYLTCNDFLSHRVDLWAMRMQKCGNQELWTKVFVVDTEGLGSGSVCDQFKPLLFLENGEIFMQWRRTGMVCYDPRTETLTDLGIYNKETWDYKAVTLTPSFVPLKDTLKVKNVLSQLRPRYECVA